MAITYGMSVKEFWEDNPDLFWAFRFSYYNKIKEENDMSNSVAWLQGAYFYSAVSVALNNAFSKEKIKYPEKPFDIKSEDKTQIEKENRIKMQVEEMKARIKQVNKIRSTAEKGDNIPEGGENK